MVWDIRQAYTPESKKIVWEVAPYLKGRGLDLGAGMFKILPQAISVDNGHHEAFGHFIQADVRVDTAEKLSIFGSESMDFVYSSHLLEHIEAYEAALKEWWRLIKVGGVLALYLPHEDFYPKVGTQGANPDHKWDVNPAKVIAAMEKLSGWDLVENQERNGGEEYSLLQVYRKVQGRHHTQSWSKQRPEKTALVCRFGAFGDLMQASSVLAGLKKQGYHVTLMTSPPGVDVILHDPNIDVFMILDKDQIPNADLVSFWAWQAKKYSKFVNLSESVEGSLLAMPGRTIHFWPPAARHTMMNRNYLETQHLLAGVPHDPQVKFYPTLEEKAWVSKHRSRMGKHVAVWSLSGSSAHKTWAGLDMIIARFLVEYPDVDVVLVGGPEGVLLEQGWENERRVHCTSGKWTIRQSLAFAQQADMVIGPETGVLNAVSHESMPKVIFLSHSSNENLTRDWVNTGALSAPSTNCKGRGDNEAPACHQMHYGWEHCTKDDETGTAQCQKDIDVDLVWHYVKSYMDQIRSRKEAA